MLAALLLASGLTGCLDAGEAGPSTETEPTAHAQTAGTAQRLIAEDCREQLGIFPMDSGAVRAYLPPGFEPSPPTPPDLYQGQDPSGQSATLLLVGFVCDQPQPTSLFLPLVPVMPPEQMRVADVYYHAVALPCIAEAETASQLATWGVPCTTGPVDIQVQAEPPGSAVWELAAEDASAAIALQGGVPASNTAVSPEWVRVFHVQDRTVCALADSRVGAHEHWQFGPTTLEVDGTPSFPVPRHPGLASLGRPGLALNVTPVGPGDPGNVSGLTGCA